MIKAYLMTNPFVHHVASLCVIHVFIMRQIKIKQPAKCWLFYYK